LNVVSLGPPRRGISDATCNGEESAEQTKNIWELALKTYTFALARRAPALDLCTSESGSQDLLRPDNRYDSVVIVGREDLG